MEIRKIEDKKGSAVKVSALVGVLLAIVMVVALAPTMFGDWNATTFAGAPGWLVTVGLAVISIGLIMFVYRAFRI